jgi:anti-anti-sigma regulatory factor
MYKLPEKIDAANAKTVEEELMKTRPVELDASSLSAVSSSGLRMLLRFSESLPGSLRLNDVSGEIYEILETTGFTEIWDVRKKPRQVEIDGLPLIGTGSWAKVYLLDEETVIKVYDSPNNDLYPDKAKYEADISREVFKRKIPTAISYNLVKCGTYDAGVYERITGPTLAEEMVKNPEKLEELTKQRDQMTAELAKLRQKLKLAQRMITDQPMLQGKVQAEKAHMREWYFPERAKEQNKGCHRDDGAR